MADRFIGSTIALAVLIVSLTGAVGRLVAEDDDAQRIRQALKDAHAEGADFWIYNDLSAAMREARRQNRPLFVTFRCIPCADCAAFDAEVAQGNEAIHQLAREKFVSVRQVEMKGVDLSQFQFDYDLNWAAMFLNADGVVYARYGTQSAQGADAYNSIEGLEKTMQRVLALHAAYPRNIRELEGKRGPKKPYRTALEMLGLDNKEKYRNETTRQNCIHCHNIHDAEQLHAQTTGTFHFDQLWRYPLPDNLGLSIDPKDGRRIQKVQDGSPAAQAGLKAGESVTHVNGQAITSIADIQWVLHHLPNTKAHVTVRGRDSGEKTLELKAGWKKTDISWRGSIWSLSPRLRVWTPELTRFERDEKGVPRDQLGLLVKWINKNRPGGRAAHDSGLREGDVIVAVEGESRRMTPPEFNVYIKLNYQVGEELPVTVLRDGQPREIRIKLAE